MRMPMKQIFNASHELARAEGFQNFRLFYVDKQSSHREQVDIRQSKIHISTELVNSDQTIAGYWLKWESTANSSATYDFSSMCLLTAMEFAQRLGNKNYTMGLLASAWGGTNIEKWMSKRALKKCHFRPYMPTYGILWNAMVKPFAYFKVKGVLWYQGKEPILSPATMMLCLKENLTLMSMQTNIHAPSRHSSKIGGDTLERRSYHLDSYKLVTTRENRAPT